MLFLSLAFGILIGLIAGLLSVDWKTLLFIGCVVTANNIMVDFYNKNKPKKID